MMLQVACSIISCNFNVVMGGVEHGIHLLCFLDQTLVFVKQDFTRENKVAWDGRIQKGNTGISASLGYNTQTSHSALMSFIHHTRIAWYQVSGVQSGPGAA